MREDKILLMRYLYGNNEVWGIPGGGVHDDETLVDTVKRELHEELGVAIEVEELLCLVETPPTGKVKHTLHCVFLGKLVGGIPQVNTEHTTALAVEWVELSALDNLTLYPPVNDAIKEVIKGDKKPQYLGLRARQWF